MANKAKGLGILLVVGLLTAGGVYGGSKALRAYLQPAPIVQVTKAPVAPAKPGEAVKPPAAAKPTPAEAAPAAKRCGPKCRARKAAADAKSKAEYVRR
jgi:hypothetical protein